MKFPNIEALAHKCAANTRDNVTISAQQARGISNEYMRMLEHIVELQTALVELHKQNQEVVKIEYDAGEFS